MVFLGGSFHPFVGFRNVVNQSISRVMFVLDSIDRSPDTPGLGLAVFSPGGERAGWNPNDRLAAFDVLAASDHSPSTDDGIVFDSDRRDHHGAGTNAHPITDPAFVLAVAVEIRRDCSRAHVHVSAHEGITQVGQVASDGAGVDVRPADLDEGSDLDVVFESPCHRASE